MEKGARERVGGEKKHNQQRGSKRILAVLIIQKGGSHSRLGKKGYCGGKLQGNNNIFNGQGELSDSKKPKKNRGRKGKTIILAKKIIKKENPSIEGGNHKTQIEDHQSLSRGKKDFRPARELRKGQEKSPGRASLAVEGG